MDGVSEELPTEYGDTAGDEEWHGPFVEEFEGEVINRDLATEVTGGQTPHYTAHSPLQYPEQPQWRF